MQLRNTTGYPLVIRKYNLPVGPGGVIDTAELGHDLEKDGVITGFEPVEDDPKPEKKAPAKASAGEKDKETSK